MDQKALMKEVSRVLKPGGVIVFSDIMQGDGGGDCTSFTGQNVVASMASPQMYKVSFISSLTLENLLTFVMQLSPDSSKNV